MKTQDGLQRNGWYYVQIFSRTTLTYLFGQIKYCGGCFRRQRITSPYFGQHTDATDSIDSSLGEYELPPSPPTGIFDSRFNLPTFSSREFALKDFRDSTQTDITWTIQFQPGSAGYPMTFSWDSTAFPEGTFYLKDRLDGSFVFVNMKNQSSLCS